jgi:pimeloyl-ACP methyl ester carboxylesterase
MAYMDIAAPGATTAAQTVVLLHGKNMGGYYWINTIRKLHDGGYRVVVPDQIGWGKSSKPDIAYSFDQLARNIAQLLDSLKLDKVIVVGHSTGGMLATRFARSYPERVTKLVLEDPVGLEDYRRKIPAQTDEALFDMEAANTNPSQIKKFFANYFSAERKELSDPLADVVIRVTKSGEWLRWAKASALAYRMIYQQPVCYEYDLLQPPTLLVVGEQDHTVVLGSFAAPDVRKTMGNFPQLGKDAVSKMPNGTLVVVPNCGHIPHMEQPEIFHKAVLDFIKK